MATVSATAQDWDYTDGETAENWSEASPEFAACDTGMMQSPVDIDSMGAYGNIRIAADYGMTDGTLRLGKHQVQIDAAPGQGMVSGDRLFNLVQVHFHTPSEHAMSGERYPLAGHFVHATREGTLGVLGVLFEEGDANEGLQMIIDAMPDGDGANISIDMSSMIPDELEVYRYMGSLTTPPCSENVNWHVVEDTVEASAEQIAAMEAALGMSARSMQPLNNRLVVAPAD
ncbi:carbonic anhydrase family protein [Erythrobacter sp. WH131]|uniref:Carbonic anhydrase family protein n=2 Tax=Erythrobacter ani TaxID=2827235 RepID=A0ABS6SRD8_9SPHN|nr:carbonic anhydrase family protein [Erythrobacter ani]